MSESRLKNRILESKEVPVKELVANSSNWRLHPVRQKAATKEAIGYVGWVERVLVNMRTGDEWPDDERGVSTLVDGHMRLEIAIEAGDETVPVDFVDLTPAEESYVLATLDPLGALARTDNEQLLELTSRIDQNSKSVRAALRAAGIESRDTLPILEGNGLENATGSRRDTESDNGQGQKPQVPSQNPQKPLQKYPLAIVLSKKDLTLWREYKERVGIQTDTNAFIDLLRAVTDDK